MNSTSYKIGQKNHEISTVGSPPFQYGEANVLSSRETDISFEQPWYEQGFKAMNFLNTDEFTLLKKGLDACVQSIIHSELGIKTESFDLNNYHHTVTTDEDHYKIVSKTRDLFPKDFNFPITEIIPKFEDLLGFKLTDLNPKTKDKTHIIVRINRPGSSDYNPPHKDIYEGVDEDGEIPQLINLWIPICGVTQNSSLPVAPASHLLPESKVLRTRESSMANGKKYRVRMIKEWDGESELQRPLVNYGEVLFFSSHLIHGLAINEEEDNTRVSLEFRLYKKD